MLTIVIAMSVTSVAAFLVTLSRVIGWRRLLAHATVIDVIFTVGAVLVFSGSLTGQLTAVLGGLIMAVVLTLIKAAIAAPAALKSGSLADTKAKLIPADADPSEYDDQGRWVYNLAPYA